MDCREAKQHIRNGSAELAAEHIAACEDCAAFAADFADVAGFLNIVACDTARPGDDALLNNTLRLARAELLSGPAGSHSNPRNMLAAAAALILAPIIILLNYGVATGGRQVFDALLSPFAGSMFFVNYIIGAALATGIAYGSLPLLTAAARNALKTNVSTEMNRHE
ncbi:MAG TPA: hypothetical protein PLN69_06725 [bacterium]|nr:hypothetical protein [bacterium]